MPVDQPNVSNSFQSPTESFNFDSSQDFISHELRDFSQELISTPQNIQIWNQEAEHEDKNVVERQSLNVPCSGSKTTPSNPTNRTCEGENEDQMHRSENNYEVRIDGEDEFAIGPRSQPRSERHCRNSNQGRGVRTRPFPQSTAPPPRSKHNRKSKDDSMNEEQRRFFSIVNTMMHRVDRADAPKPIGVSYGHYVTSQLWLWDLEKQQTVIARLHNVLEEARLEN